MEPIRTIGRDELKDRLDRADDGWNRMQVAPCTTKGGPRRER